MDDAIRPLVDLDEFGKRTKAARILSGCDSVKSGADYLRRTMGIRISDRTLYSLERGQTMPTVEQFLAITWGYRPPGYTGFFVPCFRDDIVRDSYETLEEQVAMKRQIEADDRGTR